MESLVLLVVIIISIALFSGPLALFLTWLPALNGVNTSDFVRLIRRIFVTILSLVGSFTSFNLFVSASTTAATLMGIFGSVVAFFAMKREYFPDGFRDGKPKGNGFGRWSDRRNGPDGQH